MTSARVRIAVATPLAPGLRPIITAVSERVELLVDDRLLPPQRWPGDHDGDPAFRRDPVQRQAFADLLTQAEVWYGIPDPAAGGLGAAPAATALRWVHTMAAGGGASVVAAGLPTDVLQRVTFTTSAGVHRGPLAEFAVFGVLAGAKLLPRLQADQRDRRWSERFAMAEVSGQTVLIIGLGEIGAHAATLFAALGARVIGVKREPATVPGVAEVHPLEALPELVARADAIVLALPETAATRGLYSAELIARTKPGATVVNVGRGSAVDESALINALRRGQIGFACLDVTAAEPLPPDSELWSLPNVLISPHTAALSPKEDDRIARLFADNLRRYLDGRPLVNVVDVDAGY